MTAWTVLASLTAACAGALTAPGPVGPPRRPWVADPGRDDVRTPERGLAHVLAWPLSLAAGLGATVFLGGGAGLVAGPGVVALCLRAVRRSEDPHARRRREEAAAQLPHLVLLLGSVLRGGAPPESAVLVVAAALPGAAAERLDGVRARLALGLDPVSVWEALGDDPVLAPLGRTLARASRSGAPVAEAVERLARDLADRHRAEREDRARAVGVRAALPLGLCLLPSFLLLGIVPLVAGLFAEVTR